MDGHQFRKETGHPAPSVYVAVINDSTGQWDRYEVTFYGKRIGEVFCDQPENLGDRYGAARKMAFDLVTKKVKEN